VLIADKDYYIPGTELYDTFVEWLNAVFIIGNKHVVGKGTAENKVVKIRFC